MKTTKASLLVVSLSNRIYGSSSEFTLKLPFALENVQSATLEHCSIPLTHYNVEEGVNDKLYFQEFGGGLLAATLTSGYYNAQDLIDHVCEKMTVVGTGTYEGTYNLHTFKFTIFRDSSTFKLMFAGTTDSCLNLLISFD